MWQWRTQKSQRTQPGRIEDATRDSLVSRNGGQDGRGNGSRSLECSTGMVLSPQELQNEDWGISVKDTLRRLFLLAEFFFFFLLFLPIKTGNFKDHLQEGERPMRRRGVSHCWKLRTGRGRGPMLCFREDEALVTGCVSYSSLANGSEPRRTFFHTGIRNLSLRIFWI